MSERTFNNPYRRPWMKEHGAASSTNANSSAIKSIIAGGITGGIEISITYPTEYIKTQLQLDENLRKSDGTKRYNGMIDCLTKTVSTKGFFGLYRGLSVLIFGSVPKSAVRFGTFEALKRTQIDDKGNMTTLQSLFCGLGAGVTEAILVVTPMESIKTMFISDQRSGNPRFKGLFPGVVTIIRDHGFRGIYQGLTPTIIRQGSNQAMRFSVMETSRDFYRGGDPSVPVPKILVGAFGALAGAVSVLGNTPIDVVKTRMQGMDAAQYRSTWHCLVKIWRDEGPFALYKGTVPRLGRVCADVAITFMIYDSFMDLFNKVWP